MFDTEGHSPLAPPSPAPGEIDAIAIAPVSPRSIIPRRPLRLTPTREDNPADPRQSLAALNIFADIFDPEPVPEAEANIDPRIAASRRRARARIDRHVNALGPDEANFWHVSVWNAAPDIASHMPSAILPANDLPSLPVPLHEQLARVREALYARDPNDEVGLPETPSLQIRLASHAMTATLVLVAFPVGAALTTYSLLRGPNMRLSAQAMALVAGELGFWQSGFPHLL